MDIELARNISEWFNSGGGDIKIFSELYNISIVTIDKTFKKLLNYKEQFSKLGINQI